MLGGGDPSGFSALGVTRLALTTEEARDEALGAASSALGDLSTSLAEGLAACQAARTVSAAAAVVDHCQALDLSPGEPELQHDGRGLLRTLIACDMSLATSAAAEANAEAVARAFVADHAALFGLTKGDLSDAVTFTLRRQRVLPNGKTLVTLQQQLDGLPVFTGRITVHVDEAGGVAYVNGQLTPPWALDTTGAAVDSEALESAVESALDVTEADIVATEVGVFDPARGPGAALLARPAVRVRSGAVVGSPDVFVDAVTGVVLGVDDRSAGLTAAQEHVEVYSQCVDKCVDWGDDECDTYAGSLTCMSSVDINLTSTQSWDQLNGQDYFQSVEPRMLQHSTLIQDDGYESVCDFRGEEEEEPAWSWCTYETGCVVGREDCQAAAKSASDQTTTIVAELEGVFWFYRDWTGRIGWDDEQFSGTEPESYHRLRLVTDNCRTTLGTCTQTGACGVGDYDPDGGPSKPGGPGIWVDESAVMAIAEDLDEARPFTIAHEMSHGIDFSEGNLKASTSDPRGEWIAEGIADVFGVLWHAHYLDPTNADDLPTWFKGTIDCEDPDCPCGAPESWNFAAPCEYQIDQCNLDGPGHLTEVWDGCGSNHNGFLVSKLGELMGGDGGGDSHSSWHGVDVCSPGYSGVDFDYAQMTATFYDALLSLEADDTYSTFRRMLTIAAGDHDDSDGLEDAAFDAADAVGLWNLDTSLATSNGGAATLASVTPSGGPVFYYFERATSDRIVYRTRDAEPGTYSAQGWSGTTTLAEDVQNGPAVTTIEGSPDLMYVVYADDTDGDLMMQVVDEDGDVEDEGDGVPQPYLDITNIDARTDAEPALVAYDGDLYLFFKETGSGSQTIKAAWLDLDAGTPQWDDLDDPTNPVQSDVGVSAASGQQQTVGSGVDRIYVAHRSVASGHTGETGLWQFDPADYPNPPATPTVQFAGLSSGPADQPTTDLRPTVAIFRDHLHVAAYRDGASGAIVYNHCAFDACEGTCCPALDCDDDGWAHFWPMQGNTANVPVSLVGHLPGGEGYLHLVHIEGSGATPDAFSRRKRSD